MKTEPIQILTTGITLQPEANIERAIQMLAKMPVPPHMDCYYLNRFEDGYRFGSDLLLWTSGYVMVGNRCFPQGSAIAIAFGNFLAYRPSGKDLWLRIAAGAETYYFKWDDGPGWSRHVPCPA